MSLLFPFTGYALSEAIGHFRNHCPDVESIMEATGARYSVAQFFATPPSALNAEFPGIYGYDKSGIHKLKDDGSGEVGTPRMFQAIRPGGLPVIFLYHTLSPRSRDYWDRLAEKMSGKVELLDPCRCRLSDLRKAGFAGWRVYRAAKPGMHGKSAEIRRL